MKQLVAVYGSLKRNFGNYSVMKKAKGVFQNKAISVDSHYILNGYSFPYINEEPSNPECGHLAVELFEVSSENLEGPLDSLEGNPTFYKREQRKFKLPNGVVKEAWLYIYQQRENEEFQEY